ncbi:MAG: hypothetical protein WEA61_01760 [Anaerolineales bacterium]
MTGKLDFALEECLALLQEGKLSLEECLARYPEFSDDLRPLLASAGKLSGFQALQVRHEFRARARARLVEHMHANPRREAGWRNSLAFRYAASFAVLVLALGTAGTALAQRALPGDALYQWKLTTERFWRSVQRDLISADLFLAERRATELRAVQGMPELELIGVDAYSHLIDQIKLDLTTSPDQIEWVNQVFSAHRESLSDLFANSEAALPNPDELFSTISLPTPLDDSGGPVGTGEPPQNTEGGINLEVPIVITPLPSAKRDSSSEDGGAAGVEGWLEEAIDDLLGLP